MVNEPDNPVSFSDVTPDVDVHTPVLVVGGGAAGLTAAISACSAGTDTILLERDARPAGSTAMSQGAICAADTTAQRQAGIEDSAERFYDDIMAKTGGSADDVMARLVAAASGPAMDWLTGELGLPYRVNPDWTGFFGHSANRLHSLPSQSGEELSSRLQASAGQAGVDVIGGALVERLHATPGGGVTAAEIVRPDGSRERIGCKALVAATCGFGANHEMVRRYIPDFGCSPTYRYFGHEGNDGSGIRWGMALGAATGGMDSFQGLGSLAEPQAMILNYDVIMHGGIQVNTLGARFCDELEDISGQALKVLAQPGGVVWAVFDEPRRKLAEHLPEFQTLTGLGAIRKAESAEELAMLIGAETATLRDTLATAANAAAGRSDCPFGRDFRGAAPLAPPYWTAKVTGALFHTQGGLQLDAAGRVVRDDGSRLPNFLAAGGTARGISGDGSTGYLPAAGLCTAVTLGRLAGLAAARLAGE